MSGIDALRCGACGAPLAGTWEQVRCTRCAFEARSEHGVLELAEPRPAMSEEPWPLTAVVARQALDQLRAGASWKSAFESALLALDDERAENWMQLAREARGAWLVLLRGNAGRALHVGNALSGATIALARAGFEIVLLDRSRERLGLAVARATSLTGVAPRALCGGWSARLPFADRAFDLVLVERGLPQARADWGHDLRELSRVLRGELVFCANNRLGYKRSLGRRGDFKVPAPHRWVGGALRPAHGERTLRGWRADFSRANFRDVRALALYPHLSDFTHLVGLDGAGPQLAIGPKERSNRVKMLGAGLGLFPWLTPSFGFLARRDPPAAGDTTRLERVLAQLSRHVSEPCPEPEFVLASRGNTTIVHTRVRGACADAQPGRWIVHFPLSQQQHDQLVSHLARLSLLRERFPSVPVPQPLWIGVAEGMQVACERRLGGLTAPQYTGNRAIAERMFADVARHFAALVMREARVFDAQDFERLVGSRFDLVARFAAVPRTIERLAALRQELRASLIGASFPLVLQHADLRSKHVQLADDGSVIGFLDWGSSELLDLPYFDVLHLVAHERKQEAGLSAQQAWELVRDPRRLREHERRALDGYCEQLGIPDGVRRAIESMYPVLVAAMAERNWDYSRPRWLARQFGI